VFCLSACVRDASDPAKVDHLKKLSAFGDPAFTTSRSSAPGVVKIFEADLTVPNSYDTAMAGCTCVVHVGTPMGYAGNNNPRQIFDGAVEGTMNIIDTIKRVVSVKRLICTVPGCCFRLPYTILGQRVLTESAYSRRRV
jgi:dihydroflavonol-4-reductase